MQSASSRHLALHVESVDSTDSGDSQDYELQPDMEMEEAQNGSPAIEVDRSIDTDSVAIESGEIPGIFLIFKINFYYLFSTTKLYFFNYLYYYLKYGF